MKKTAVLLDLGFVLHKLRERLSGQKPTADNVHHFARECVTEDEELFRIYCYHSKPYGETRTHPLTRSGELLVSAHIRGYDHAHP